MVKKITHSNAWGKGISSENRQLLTALHRNFPGPFSIDEAAGALKLTRDRVVRLLPYLASQGWLKRVHQGLYTVVPLEAVNPEQWTKDPWVIISRVFQPGYIGGWSACQHWELTDQLFRSVVAYTTKPIRQREGSISGVPYVARMIVSPHLFGIRKLWREETTVNISDPSRTIVDILDAPAFGGGIRHVSEILRNYFLSEYVDEELLLQYIEQFGNRAIYKRLGFMADRFHFGSAQLLEMCREKIGRGRTKLDPGKSTGGRFNPGWLIVENVKLSPD